MISCRLWSAWPVVNRMQSSKEGGAGVKLALAWRRVASAVLGVCVALGVSGQGMAGESQHSGWYAGAGAGVNWISDMEQAGWNRDTICYPTDDCTGKASIGGYRWFYDLDADRGSLFEIGNWPHVWQPAPGIVGQPAGKRH